MARIGPSCCAICAKRTHLCHFGVPSCLGCRSFFRRSALQQKTYRCTKFGNCSIENGVKCRACRFDRCVLRGMNVRAIMAKNKLKIDQISEWIANRRKELKAKKNNGKNEEKTIMEGIDNTALETPQKEFYLLDSLRYVEERLVHIRFSETECSQIFQWKSLNELFAKRENILAKSDSFSMVRRVRRPKQFFFDLIAIGGSPHTPEITDQRVIEESINWVFFDCFLCFEMAKTMPSICKLPPDDKIALLLNNTILSALFGQYFYNICANDETLTFPNGFSPIFFGILDVPLRVFCEAIKPYKKINLCHEEFLIIRSIILHQNAGVDISPTSHQILQNEIEKFVNVLMRFEKMKFGDEMGVKRFAELMFFVNHATQLAIEHRNFIICYMSITAQRQKIQFSNFAESLVLGICVKDNNNNTNCDGKRIHNTCTRDV